MTEFPTEPDADKNLVKNSLDSLMIWTNKQPDLPNIDEFQATLFLHSCYYNEEATKITIKKYFHFRSKNPEMFTNRDPSSPAMQTIMNHCLITTLPQRTPEDFTIFFVKFLEDSANNFNLLNELKYFNMVIATHLQTEKLSTGHLLLVDVEGLTFGHLLKLRPLMVKRFLFYLQEALPLRLKGLHFFNIKPVFDKILAFLKPFIKKELIDVLYLHDTVESLQEFIPIDCLPKDYGGSAENTSILLENIKNELIQNSQFFTDNESNIETQGT